MVTATSVDELSMYHGYFEEPSGMVSDELLALADIARRLGSFNCINEPGIVDETRKEAKLLMSLMLSTIPPLHSEEAPEFESVSSSDNSFSSDSSSSKRDTFTFTCPSLSLENPGHSPTHLNHESTPTKLLDRHYVNTKEAPPHPAILLGRPLKVDDRDALRLSADAMARNVLQSFQKAMDWRLRTWIYELSMKLATQERSMLEAGASEEEIKALLNTAEAAIVVALRGIAEEDLITFQSASTSFEILSKRIENDIEEQGSTNGQAEKMHNINVLASEAKRQLNNAVASTTPVAEEGYYQYSVTHQLQFSCMIHLETPAGFSEIEITVPGTMTGAFQSSAQDPTAELRSVVIDLDTNILAAIVEKSCRAIVRSIVEVAMAKSEDVENEDNIEEAEAEIAPEATLAPVTTPPRNSFNGVGSKTAFITPRSVSQENQNDKGLEPSTLLPPIPDDFGHKTDKPRRISPQPTSLGFGCDSVPFGPRTSTKRGSPTSDTTTTTSSVKRRLPLISPLSNEKNFHEVPENGPSLPMLAEFAEVACRALPFN